MPDYPYNLTHDIYSPAVIERARSQQPSRIAVQRTTDTHSLVMLHVDTEDEAGEILNYLLDLSIRDLCRDDRPAAQER
jgi:hypothetical protein